MCVSDLLKTDEAESSVRLTEMWGSPSAVWQKLFLTLSSEGRTCVFGGLRCPLLNRQHVLHNTKDAIDLHHPFIPLTVIIPHPIHQVRGSDPAMELCFLGGEKKKLN